MTRRIRDEKKESDDAAAIVLDDDRVVSNYDKQSSSTSSSDAMMLQQEQQQQNREIQELRLQVAELQAALQQERYHRNHHLFYSVWCTLNHWLHARTGRPGCQWGGYIRVIYAVLFLYSRLWFAYDVVFLLHPVTGVIPYHATRRALDDSLHYSLFQWFPHSAWLLYVLVAQGLLCGLGLLLGVQPRLCAVGIFFFLYNMYHQNQLIYDHQDIMLRVWSFMLLLLPLDHITIYDGFGGLWQRLVPKSKNTSTTSALSSDKPQSQLHQQQQSQQTSSWPMWPFRIWQVYTVMVYSAAALGKLDSQVWVNGTAMYYVGYEDGFRGPDFIFNRLWGIKLVTWSALFLELSCFMTIWPLTTRRWTFWMVVLLHVGIELTMWMHIFQYLSVLGWFVFFVQPMDDEQQEQDNKNHNHNQQDKDDSTNTIQSPQKHGVHGNAVLQDVAKIGRSEMSAAKSTLTRATTIRWALQRLLHTCVAVALLSLFVIDTAPTVCCGVLPFDSWQDAVYDNIHIPLEHWRREWVTPFLTRLGLHSGVWGLFWGVPSMRNHGYTAVIRFHPNQKNNKINTNTTNNNNSTQDDSVVVWTNPYSTTLWKDAFYFYLWDQLEDSPRDGFPMVVSFMEYLARRHSVPGALVHAASNKDNTNHHHDSLLYVYPNNTVASISLVVHWESGVHPREDLTLWEPARGPMIQGSECMYVLELPQVEENGNDDHDTTPASVYLEYAYNERRSYNAQSNCLNYNARADDPYHYQTKPKTKFSDWNNDRHYDRYYGSGEVEEEIEEEEEEEEEEERGEGVDEGEEEDEDEEDDEEADEEEEEDEEDEPNELPKILHQSYAQHRGEGEAATTETSDTPRHSVKDEF